MEELKNMTIVEIKDLLKTNTIKTNYNPDVIKDGYEIVYNEFVTNQNYITEEKKLWDVILMGFYNFDEDTIEILSEKLGWYELMVWCFKNLKSNEEIEFYYNRYFEYHKEKSSVAEILTAFIGAFVDDLGSLQPESLVDYAKDLGKQLDKLPDIVKDQIK